MPAKKRNIKTASGKWPITTERFVAFIDIMGFKDMVAKMSHADIYRIMQTIDMAKTLNEGVYTGKENPKLVKSTAYSDSIMLYSKDKTINAFISLITAVSGLANDLFIEGIPHKGAIAFGKMTLDTERSIFFGQPLIDAYLLQEELHFYGVIIHGTVEEVISDQFNAAGFIKKYDCQLKNGKSSHFTVYPMHADGDSAKDYPEYHQKIVDSLNRMKYKTSGHLRRYIDNTGAYFKFLIDQND